MTGEHPAQPLGESSTVKVSLVVILLGVAATAGTAHYRIGAAEQKQTEQATQIRTNESAIAELKTRTAVNESGFSDMKEQLREANAKLDRLLEKGGTVSAKGRQ